MPLPKPTSLQRDALHSVRLDSDSDSEYEDRFKRICKFFYGEDGKSGKCGGDDPTNSMLCTQLGYIIQCPDEGYF